VPLILQTAVTLENVVGELGDKDFSAELTFVAIS